MAVTRRHRLNLRNYGNLPAIMLSQYDEGYALVFDIYDGVNPSASLSAYTVKLKGVRYDGLAYEFTGTITGESNNVLSFVIDTTMSACPGKGTAEIAIIDSSNDVLFATFNLPVFVEKAAVPDGSVDADVERAEELAEQIQEIVDTAAATVSGEAEKWATGQIDGTDVPSTDPAYENNAKYYAEQAADSAASIGIDATLTQAGKAADAKKTGDEITELKEDFNDIKPYFYKDENLLVLTSYASNSNAHVTNNGDGTFTFGNDYGTTAWVTQENVPVGTYTLQGRPATSGAGKMFVSTQNSYTSGVIAETTTTDAVTFENTTAQKLYYGIRQNVPPSAEFTFAPMLAKKVVDPAFVNKHQDADDAGKALIVGATGEVGTGEVVTPAEVTGVSLRVTNLEGHFPTKRVSITKQVSVSGTLDSGVSALIGLIIPQGIHASVTISTDMQYRGDKFAVQHNDNALFTTINQTFSNQQYYNNEVTYDVSYADSLIQNLKVELSHIASTSGTITIKVEFDDGSTLLGFDNVSLNSVGLNLIDPQYVYAHVALNGTSGVIERRTSDLSMGYVPIPNGGTVTFNKTIKQCAIVHALYDGTFDVSTFAQNVNQATNSTGTDGYLIFDHNTSEFQTLIAVVGIYAADYTAYNPMGAYVEKAPNRAYGTIGLYYPDEAKNSKRFDSTQDANRLRFVHITDTHESGKTPLMCADEFTDLSSAKFLTLTGDLVNDKITNSVDNTVTAINAMTKPCYICMGNHDVWNDTNPTQRYTKYFNPIAEHNGLAQNISYYAVDFASEKVKCIWLDLYELSTGTPSLVMSSAQINWLLGQLDDAILNSYHVCIFAHNALAPINPIEPFFDHQPVDSVVQNLKWILDTVNAFQTGGSVTFTHNGTEYTHTFSGHGVFVAYFNGHTHWDAVGWIKDYNQLNVTCNRAKSAGETYDCTYRAEKLGCTYNYVAIDATWRRLSVIRIGNSNTIAGIKRDAFTVTY